VSENSDRYKKTGFAENWTAAYQDGLNWAPPPPTAGAAGTPCDWGIVSGKRFEHVEEVAWHQRPDTRGEFRGATFHIA